MADKKTLELQIKLAAEQAANQIKIFSQDIKNASQNAEGLKISQKSVNSMVKSLQTEAKRAATSLKLFGGSTSELRNQQSKMKQTVLDLIDHGLKPESVEVQNLVQQYKNLDTELSKTEAKQDGLMGVISKLKTEMGSLAAVAAAVAFDKALAGAAKGALEVSDSFRGAKEEFGIMLGDMQAGAGLFDELQEFNFWTPFDIEQTSQAAKVLMAAKVPLGEITDYLTRFGDIAQGDGQKFQSFINAFSKASAKGKADMEVLNVYIDQGVQILDVLAQQMGITTAEVVDFSSKGKISFEQFNQALASLAAEGGLYYNSMATAAMRLSSVQAGLEESVKSLKASIGDMLAPVVSKVLELFTNIVDKINNSPILKGVLLGAITALTVAINIFAGKTLVALVIQTHAGTVALTALGTAAHAMLGPIGLVTLAVGAVVGLVATMASEQQKANEETNAAALALKKQAQGYDELKIAAENYMSFIEQMSIEDAKKVAESYKNIIIPEAEKAVKEAKNKLAETPEFTTIKHSARGGGRVVEWTEKVSNPAYAEAQEELAKAELQLNTYLARQETALANVKKLEEHAKELVASFGTEWQDKLSSETAKINEQEQKALDKLNAKAKETLGQNYVTHEAYQKELSALKTYYAKKRQEEADKAAEKAQKKLKEQEEEKKRIIEQAQKTISQYLKTPESEYKSQLEALKNAAEIVYGETYATKQEFTAAEQKLKLEYENELKKSVINEHELRMKNIKEEYEYRAALARNRIEYGDRSLANYADYSVNSAVTTISETDLGKTMMGTDPITLLIDEFIEALMEIESVANILNWAGTIVENTFEVIGPLIDTLFKPLSDVLEQIGQTVGAILAPLINTIVVLLSPFTPLLNMIAEVLNIVGKAFVWLNNKVIVPFGNTVIKSINAIIKLINNIPGINIKTIKTLQTVEMNAKELADQTSKEQEILKKKYQQMENAINDQLQSQLNAIKTQYELGLISREMYESQAAKYKDSADKEIAILESELADKLETISEGKSIKDITDLLSTMFSNPMGKNIKDVIDQLITMSSNSISTMKNNQNSSVATKSKSKVIDSYTLLKNKNTIAGSNLQVLINVGGSVVSEKELTDIVYSGIAKGIQQKKYAALPGVAI